MEQSRMNNLEQSATLGTQDENNNLKNKNKQTNKQKQSKNNNITKWKIKQMYNMDPTKKAEVKPAACEEQAIPGSITTLTMLLK